VSAFGFKLKNHQKVSIYSVKKPRNCFDLCLPIKEGSLKEMRKDDDHKSVPRFEVSMVLISPLFIKGNFL